MGVLLAFFAGCAMEEAPSSAECRGLFPSDLLLTEVMANPTGPDRGREWFEIYNPGPTTISLAGVRLVTSTVEGGSEKSVLLREGTIAGGSYLVFGDGPEETPYLDRSYGTKLGALRNTSGRIALTCGGQTIAELIYPATREGRSYALSGDLVTSGFFEEAPRYCEARDEEYEPGNYGTPGRPNEICPREVSEGRCLEGEVERAKVSLRPGDLRIEEILPDPSAVPDRDGEWFEVTVARDVDLAGLEIGLGEGNVKTRFDDAFCRPAKAGDRLVFARVDDPERNGGLPHVDHVVSVLLPNGGGELVLSSDGELLDRVVYGRAIPGVAFSRDPEADDDDPVFCPARDAYGAGDLGTPGMPNPPCRLPRRDGQCRDGEEWRASDPPLPGDVVISEVLASSRIVPDAVGEWIELRIDRDLDLNGLALGTSSGSTLVWQTLDAEACLRVQAGSYVVLARSLDPLSNGGVEPVDFVQTIVLRNSNGRLVLRHGEVELDAFEWTSARKGVAMQRDADDVFCAAALPYGEAPADDSSDLRNLGTPGAPNPSCSRDAPELPEEPEGPPLPEGSCRDGEEVRPIVRPTAGDLVLSEVLANSRVVPDAAGEWIEIEARRDVDLLGLSLGTAYGTSTVWETFEGSECLRLSAGAFFLLARNEDATRNGGLPLVDRTFAFALRNSNGHLTLAYEGEVLDELRWATTTSGVAIQRDADGRFCPARVPYGPAPEGGEPDLRNRGTPGEENLACP